MKKQKAKIMESLNQIEGAKVEHIIINKACSVLYANNDLKHTQAEGCEQYFNKKCYEMFEQKEQCVNCMLEEAIEKQKPCTWEAIIKNKKGLNIKKEITLYPTFNGQNEIEKIVEVRLETKNYEEDNIVEVFSCIAESKEDYACEHSKNVYKFAKLIGQAMKFREEELKNLVIAAKLHDIGNIVISDDILGKTEKMTDQEINIIKKHPIFSEEILG